MTVSVRALLGVADVLLAIAAVCQMIRLHATRRRLRKLDGVMERLEEVCKR